MGWAIHFREVKTHILTMSICWFNGKITGKSHISWENLWFPVDFPLVVNPLTMAPTTRSICQCPFALPTLAFAARTPSPGADQRLSPGSLCTCAPLWSHRKHLALRSIIRIQLKGLGDSWTTFWIPSGELSHSYCLNHHASGKIIGRSTISMAIFKFANCLSLPEGINHH